MKFILGKKLEMTQIFQDDGRAVPVTKIQAGPCTVAQIRTNDKDGYQAVQFGYGVKKEKNTSKSVCGHLKGLENFRYLKEMRVTADEEMNLKRGNIVDLNSFVEGDKVSVTANSKGRGFQGVVKRYGFSGSLKTHGHKDQHRMPGSIGATGPAHVFKGTRMGGHMGDEQVTIKNLTVIKVDPVKSILYVEGAVPGARNGLVIIKGDGELRVLSDKKQDMITDNKEEIKDKEIEEIKEDKKLENNKTDELVETERVTEAIDDEKKSKKVEQEK